MKTTYLKHVSEVIVEALRKSASRMLEGVMGMDNIENDVGVALAPLSGVQNFSSKQYVLGWRVEGGAVEKVSKIQCGAILNVLSKLAI